ncbi:hypothetical protein ACOMHN_029675 [Nucella lapillus]
MIGYFLGPGLTARGDDQGVGAAPCWVKEEGVASHTIRDGTLQAWHHTLYVTAPCRRGITHYTWRHPAGVASHTIRDGTLQAWHHTL